jgi:hypothetical protein
MSTHTAIEDADAISPSECWCCGMTQPTDKMVHLGNHPEVAICVKYASSVKNWAGEIEDQARTALLVRQRDSLRHARQHALRKDWHQHPALGRPVRWLGRQLP